MTRRKLGPLTREIQLRAESIKARTYPDLTGWQWAWGFLRRNEKYINAYSTFAGLAPHIQKAVNDPELEFPSDAPIECFDLRPVPKMARTYGEWKAEVAARQISAGMPQGRPDIEATELALTRTRKDVPLGKIVLQQDRHGMGAGFHEKFDSDVRFGIEQWLDPTTSEVELRTNPFVKPSVPVVFASRFFEGSAGSTLERQALSFEWEFERDSDSIVIIDAALPIDEQLESARDQLIKFSKRFQAFNRQSPPQNQIGGTDQEIMLKILDLYFLGLSDPQMIHYLPCVPRTGSSPDEHWVKSRRHAAIRLREYGYRFTAFR